MDILQDKSNSIAILRQKAEELIKKSTPNSDLSFLACETLELIRELELQQVESEMHNKELVQTQTLAQNAADLYNYAPIGYFTLSQSAEIIDLNNTGADLVKTDKAKLIGSSFDFFVTDETKPIFKNFLHKVFISRTNENCEITLSLPDNSRIDVCLTGSLNKTKDLCLVTLIDISEKKQDEASIQQEREFYKDLVNSQPAGIYRIRVFSKEKWRKNAWESSQNPPYKMELASNRFCEILGITHSEFEANTAIISDLIHPDDKPEFTFKNEEANTKIISFEWEGRLIIQDKIKWVHLESFPRPLENGDIIWTGIIYNITDRKQTELALKESDERFQMLFNKAPLGYQSLDINGNFIEVNQQWLDTLGYQREEVIGKWFGDFMPPFYQERVKVNFPKFKAQGHIHAEFEMIHKNGTTLFIAFDGKIGYDVDGNFKQTHCILQDITESKRINDALLEAEWKFRALFELGPIAVAYHKMIYDEAGKPIDYYFIDANESYNKLTGVCPKGMTVRQAFPGIENDTADWIGTFGHVAKTGETIRFEQFLESNGRWYDCVGYQYKPDHFVAAFSEITLRKQTENALRESEEKFRNTFENSIIGMSLTSIDGKLRVNRSFSDIVGYSEKELNQMKWQEFTHKDDVELNERIVKLILTGEKDSERWEKRFIHKNGNIVWVDISTSLQRDKAGNPLFFITSINDITYRKYADNELKESREQFKDLFENAPVGYHEIDVDGKIVRMNKTELDLLGYSNDEVIGRFFWELTPDKKNSKQSISAKLKGEAISNNSFEREFCRKDGTKIPVLIQDVILRDAVGNIMGIRSTVQDITERKKWEKALLHSEDKFKKAFMTSPDCFSINLLGDGMYVAINNGFTKIIGYTEEEIIGKTSIEKNIWYDLKDRKRWVDELKRNGKVENFIARFRTKKGEMIYGLVSATFIELEGIKHVLSITRDITEIKKAENELIEKEVQYHNLANSGTALIWAAGLDKLCFYFNEPWLKFTGRKLEQELGNGWTESVHPDDFDHCLNTYVTSFDKRMAFEMEYRMRNAEGQYRWILDLGKPNFNSSGEFVGYIGHCFDITERKKTEKALRESEDRLELFFSQSLDGFFFMMLDEPVQWDATVDKEAVLDYVFAHQRITKFNDAMLKQYSITGDKFINLTPNDLFTHDIEAGRKVWRHLFDTGQYHVDTDEKKFDGSDMIIEGDYICLYDSQHRITGHFGVQRDVTSYRMAEKQLRENEKKLSTLFGSMTEMVVIHELVLNEIGAAIDYRIIDCNDTFTQITGIEKESANGKLATEVYQTNRAPYLEEYAKVCITGESLEYKTYFAPMDKHFLISAVSTGINQFATITTDITAIQKTQEIITEKNKELENYIYVASHDLRSPLVNIQGFSQRLERQINELNKIIVDNSVHKNIKSGVEKITNEEVPKSLNFIMSNVLKMDTLINGLLQLSRTGRIVMAIRKIDMNKLLKSILSAHNYELTEINANVQVDNLADCYGDENQLNQLFSNIINNAIKYRDKSRQLHIKISSQDFFNRVVYSVKDSGVGINTRHLEKIWDVFYRVDSSSPESGEGIGLSLARRIVDKHEGRIWVESEEGKGSTFFIELHKNEFGE